MADSTWAGAVSQINDRLKAAGLPVRVLLRGKTALTLQATLPKKPGQGEGKKQQEISLGIKASREGLRRIESEAHVLARLLINGSFDWSLYMAPESVQPPMNTSELIAAFKANYFASNQIQEMTWHETWQRTFDRLPQDEPLSEASVLAVVMLTENHTRSRELTCQRLQRLAEFAGISIDLKVHQGAYSEASLTPRDLPDDRTILDWWNRIENPQWRWVYGMMATFGLRPHECFFCTFINSRTLHVLKGKTGFHVARPLLPEWVERWELIQADKPNVSGRSFRDYGQRTYRQFERYNVPFNPYDLRHAYAIRGIVLKVPVQVMAGMMGHSVQVHTRTYNRWLKDSVAEQIYQDIFKQRFDQSSV